MRTRMKSIYLTLIAVALLGGCAASAQLSNAALELKSNMTVQRADEILGSYLAANARRGGACLVGISPGASLDYEQPVTIRDGTIRFTGRIAKTSGSETKTVSLDARSLHEIRLLDRNLERLKPWCPNIRPGFLVVLKSDALPDASEFSFNLATADEVDRTLAALTYLSPKARLVGGIGM